MANVIILKLLIYIKISLKLQELMQAMNDDLDEDFAVENENKQD